jgi:hypothetical protein
MFHFGHLRGLNLTEERLPLFPPHSGAKRYVLMVGETPVLLLLLVPLGVGSQEVILFPGERIREHRKSVVKVLRESLEDYFQTEGLMRMQATTKDEPKYHRFMGGLGFEVESVLEKYSDGKDYLMWKVVGGTNG